MKWVQTYNEGMPPKDTDHLVVKGSATFTLLDKYSLPDHGEIMIGVGFVAILNRGINYYSDGHSGVWFNNPDIAISITNILSACCTSNEGRASHSNKFKEWGLNRITYRKFVKEKNAKFDNYCLDEWLDESEPKEK